MAKPRKKPAAAGRNLLAEAVQALNTNVPLFASVAEMQPLLTDQRGPLVEYNEQMKQGDNVAFRATALGAQVHNAAQQPAPQGGGWSAPPAAPAQSAAPSAPSAASAKSFNFDANVPLPAPRRGGRGSAVYGFEQMTVGQSFYIPADKDNPNPAKRIASTVSSASKRLEPKKFVVRSVDETAQGRGKGARVWRTA
jgi:hypothetical protein